MTEARRYVYDPLYGKIDLPSLAWRVAFTPEVQRLREIRMCNINSLTLTGGANINRYEHALGTAYLALQSLERWPLLLAPPLRRALVTAAIVHDVNSAAFGHSVEYSLSGAGFDHTAIQETASYQGFSPESFSYRTARLQPIFFGMPPQLGKLLSGEDFDNVAELVRGRGPLGPMISGSLDLDNIDNVWRLAFHYGFVANPGGAARELARSLWTEGGVLHARPEAIPLIVEWQAVRRRLYRFLLLNPDEFSAKCMLEEALWLAGREIDLAQSWTDVDFQLLARLDRANADASEVIKRLVVGDLYGCVAIFETEKLEAASKLKRSEAAARLEKVLAESVERFTSGRLRSPIVRLHAIADHRKTDRSVAVMVDGEQLSIGTDSRRLLIGVFLKNQRFRALDFDLTAFDATGAVDHVLSVLREHLGLTQARRLPLYNECDFN